jgi:two-component system, cell cycle sensor histidine kinase and response regulator CckA
MEVSSEIGSGATFRVYLSAAAENPPDLAQSANQEPLGGAEKVIWVEDDKSLRTAVTQILQNYGYTVFAADSGVDAQRLWDEHGGRFDLLLTDMVLPGRMTGLDLAEKLRCQKAELRVILTSGFSEELARSDIAKEKGITFLRKPFSIRVLGGTVRKCLDSGQPGQN